MTTPAATEGEAMMTLDVGAELYAFVGPVKANRMLMLEVITRDDGKPAECRVTGCNQRKDNKRIGDRYLVRASDLFTSRNGKPCIMLTAG